MGGLNGLRVCAHQSGFQHLACMAAMACQHRRLKDSCQTCCPDATMQRLGDHLQVPDNGSQNLAEHFAVVMFQASGFAPVAGSGNILLKLVTGGLNCCDFSDCSLQYPSVLHIHCQEQLMKECRENMPHGVKTPSTPPDYMYVLRGRGGVWEVLGCSPGYFRQFPGILSS